MPSERAASSIASRMPTKMRSLVVRAFPTVCSPTATITTMPVKVPPVSTEILKPMPRLCHCQWCHYFEQEECKDRADAGKHVITNCAIACSGGRAASCAQVRQFRLHGGNETVKLRRCHG